MESKSLYKTIREEVAIYLKNKILRGEIKQGDRIKETEIANELGISRGPVREAFRQIEQEGLITYSSHKGCTVKVISAEDSAELYLLRATLENLAVKLCGGKYQKETIEKMENIVLKMDGYSKAEDLLNIIECDQKFHELIVKESKKEKLYDMWSTLDNANAVIYYALYKSRYAPGSRLSKNHMMVVDAFKKGDYEEICSILQEHYMIVSKNLYKTENVDVDFTIDL